LDLLEETLFGVVAQVELFTELLHEFERLVVFEHFDLLNVFAIQFNLQHTDGLFHSRREVGRLASMRLLINLILIWRWSIVPYNILIISLVSGVTRRQLLVRAERVVDHGWLEPVMLCGWSSIFVICRTSTRRAVGLLRCVG